MKNTKKSPEIEYHWLNKLKIPILEESNISHVTRQDLDKRLSPKQMATFFEFFGVQTCLRRKDGRAGLYAWDVEDVLVRMFEKKLTGTQLIWD